MEKTHTYSVRAWWVEGKSGLTTSGSALKAIGFAAPPQFGGVQDRWSPEDLLLSAVASCFTNTFNALAEHASYPYLDLEVEVEGTVAKTNLGYRFTGILIRPRLKITEDETLAQALELLHRAKTLCLVCRAIDAVQEFQPLVEMSRPVSAVCKNRGNAFGGRHENLRTSN